MEMADMDEAGNGGWLEGTRPRNILTLEERVRAIREFDRQPVYQKVADIMNCSAKQIRNIVVNRDSILLYYASKTGDCQGGFSKHKDRDQKIELLNRVMFEWIQRTQSREDIGRISTKLIRTIALDVKNHIKVPSFYPNSVWLNNFMEAYNINEEDLTSRNIYQRSGEAKELLSLKISDIVDDVREVDSEANKGGYKVPEIKNKSYRDTSSMLYESSNSGTGEDFDEVRVVIEEDDDDDGIDDYNNEEDDYLEERPSKKKKRNTNVTAAVEEKTINSYEEALRHLKPLEDFVLLEENFRAIGVISQLETIFRNPNRFPTD